MSAPFAFIAGEASGDLLAAPVIAALRARVPGTQVVGVAGERMIAQGCEAWHHVRELSVRGYVEVLRELPRLVRLRRALERRLREANCACVVGVDSPDFNLALETRLRESGTRTVHFVSPSIWAWRANRMERIRRAADRVLLVFPFEEEIYRRAGVCASYVGHPLASQIPREPDRAAARSRLGLPEGGQVFALLPGSRRTEVEYIGPVLLDAARRILGAHRGARFVLPVADRGLRARLEQMCAQGGAPGAGRPDALTGALSLVDGRSHDCLEACDAAIVASGTATLEAALYQRPMVIAYLVPALSAWIMRRIGGYLPWFGLPNILAGETIVDEFVQEDATAAKIATGFLRLVDDAPRCRDLAQRFARMHAELRRDTAALAAQAILDTARGGPAGAASP
jgi:lipid-A-disaccharide synthase